MGHRERPASSVAAARAHACKAWRNLKFVDDCDWPLFELPAAGQQDDVASCFSYYADLAEKLDGRQWQPVDLGEDDFKSAIRREPLGVVVRGRCGAPAANTASQQSSAALALCA
jgi:hypothetical protein